MRSPEQIAREVESRPRWSTDDIATAAQREGQIEALEWARDYCEDYAKFHGGKANIEVADYIQLAIRARLESLKTDTPPSRPSGEPQRDDCSPGTNDSEDIG